MSDASSILLRLIDAAERVLCVRALGDELHDIAPAIEALQSQTGVWLSPAPELLLRALCAVYRCRDQASTWRMIAGCLLPIVREDLSRVIEARKQPAAGDGDLPYWHK